MNAPPANVALDSSAALRMTIPGTGIRFSPRLTLARLRGIRIEQPSMRVDHQPRNCAKKEQDGHRVDGYIPVPDGPGLGTEIDEDLVRRYRVL